MSTEVKDRNAQALKKGDGIWTPDTGRGSER